MRDRIYNQNPWWQEPGLIDSDFKIEEFSAQPLKFHSKIIEDLDYSNPGIYTLRGPRQIGKSTAIKLIIKNLIYKSKINPRFILFYSCEDISDYKELITMIESFYEMVQENSSEAKLIYIFLDEVSFVEEWQRGIKALYERALLKRTFLLVSGSNAYDLHHQAERLPGRRGKDPFPDKTYLPLNFKEFCNLTYPQIEIPNIKITSLCKNPKKNLKALKELDIYSSKLKQAWNIYKLTGGFMTTINDYYQNKTISENFYQNYLQWIKGDINKLKRSEKIARQILYEVCLQMINRIDWQSIAKKVEDVQHYSSIVEYLEILESFFINKIVYQIDLHKKITQIKKQKKIYFIDNFIFWTILNWSEKYSNTFNFTEQKALEIEDKLVESFVAQTLLHHSKQNYLEQNLFFWNGDKEIDFMIFDEEHKLLPIEVKYQNQISYHDCSTMQKHGFQQGLVVSKKNLELIDQNFMVIPYYLFGLLE